MPIITNLTDTEHILDEAITTAKLDALAVTAEKIAAGSIITEKLAADAVTAEKIAADTITANEIAADTITTSELAADSVTATEIDVVELSAISANLGTITAGSATFTESGEVQIHPDSNTGIKVLDDAANAVFKILVGGTDVGDVLFGDVSKTNAYMQWDKSASKLIVGDIESPDYVANDTGYKLSSTAGLEINTGELRTPRFKADASALCRFFTEQFSDKTQNVWETAVSGSGYVVGDDWGLVAGAGGTATTDKARYWKGKVHWDYDPRFIIKGMVESGTGDNEGWIVMGESAYDGSNVNEHIGFKFNNTILYATAADGGTETAIDITPTGFNWDASHEFAVVYDEAEGSADFYVDGNLEGTITTNLPYGEYNRGILDVAAFGQGDSANGAPNARVDYFQLSQEFEAYGAATTDEGTIYAASD